MNSVSNVIAKSFSKKPVSSMTIQYIMWIIFIWVLAIGTISWSCYVMSQDDNKGENIEWIKRLLLIAGSLNVIIVIILIVYVFYMIKYKIGPGGAIGNYNIESLWQTSHIGFNSWMLLLLAMNIASTGLFFAAWHKCNIGEDDLSKMLITTASSLLTLFLGGWILYYVYLGIACRSNELFHIISELNKTSPNIVKISNDWEKTLRRKGEDMGIDLYTQVKEVLLAT